MIKKSADLHSHPLAPGHPVSLNVSIGDFGSQEISADDEAVAVAGHEGSEKAIPGKSLAKRMIDVSVGLCLIILALPMMLVISFLLWNSGGPIFFRQQRIGFGGKPFVIIKFRTMHTNASEIIERLFRERPDLHEEWLKTQKLTNDPRVTPLGKFMRSTSLDELPQLFNVIAGDMSLVGPRPIIQSEIQRYGLYYSYYTWCRPGLTGLWQVSGRSNTSYDFRVKCDTEYAKKQSIWGDFLILLKTIPVVLSKDGAF